MSNLLAAAPGAGGHPFWHFALVAGAGVLTFAGIKTAEWWKHGGRHLHVRRPSAPLVVLALFGLGASVVHGLVGPEHFREWVVYGVFFVCACTLQAVWSVLVLLRPTRLLLAAGAWGNAAVVLTFLVSRISGMPFGPQAFRPEELNAAAIAATICELAVVVGASYLLSRPDPARLRRRAELVPVPTA